MSSGAEDGVDRITFGHGEVVFARRGMLATFDRKLSVAAVAEGQTSLRQIES